MTYQWKSGSRFGVEAQIAGEMCEALAASDNLTAKALLDANRPEDAPLHGEFEWDDGTAAELYREDQARKIIRCLCTTAENTEEPVRAYYNLVREEPQYRSIETILRAPDETEMLLRTALNELTAIQRKYGQLQRLAGVFAAIDQVKMDLPA